MNYSDDELRTDVHFNRSTITEAPSNYSYGLSPINAQKKTMEKLAELKSRVALAGGALPKSKIPHYYKITLKEVAQGNFYVETI